MSDISINSCHIIIAGDFNIDLLQINERSEFQKYFDLFVTHGFFQISQYLQDAVNLVRLLLIKCFANLKSHNNM